MDNNDQRAAHSQSPYINFYLLSYLLNVPLALIGATGFDVPHNGKFIFIVTAPIFLTVFSLFMRSGLEMPFRDRDDEAYKWLNQTTQGTIWLVFVANLMSCGSAQILNSLYKFLY